MLNFSCIKRDEKVVAAASLMFDPAVARLAELMASGQIITKTQAQWVKFCKRTHRTHTSDVFYHPVTLNYYYCHNTGNWFGFFFIYLCVQGRGSDLAADVSKQGPVLSSHNQSITRVTVFSFTVPPTEFNPVWIALFTASSTKPDHCCSSRHCCYSSKESFVEFALCAQSICWPHCS